VTLAVARGPVADEIRRLLDRGLARYGRGQLVDAKADWEEAMRLDPGNLEARALIDFVRPKIAAAEADDAAHGEGKRTDPVLPAYGHREGDWSENEGTDPSEIEPSDPGQTARVRQLGDSADSDVPRRSHETVASPIPTLLAKTTAPNWTPAPEDREEGAPETFLHDEDTRRLGSEAHAVSDESLVPPTVESPVHDPAREARLRASELVDLCRAAFGRGKLDEAAAAAEEVLKEGERAPEPGIPEVIEPARPLLEQVFAAYVGTTRGVPASAMDPDALVDQDLDHRAGFLLSQIDGSITVEQLIDVSSMPKFETLRILCSLKRVRAIRML